MASMLHLNETVTKGLVAVMQVEGSAGSEGEEEVQESPRRILAAAVGNKRSPVVSWSARQTSRRASLSPQSNRQVHSACHQCPVSMLNIKSFVKISQNCTDNLIFPCM